MLQSCMFILSITLPNLSIPDMPFPTILSALIRRRFQVNPATLLIPIDLFSFLLVEEFYGTQYRSGSFSLIIVGSSFSLPTSFFPLFFLLLPSQSCLDGSEAHISMLNIDIDLIIGFLLCNAKRPVKSYKNDETHC